MRPDLMSLVNECHGTRRESEAAWFLTPTPWVAPMAYQHIVFKPAAPQTLAEFADCLEFPEDLSRLLSETNGAFVFSWSLALYGVVDRGRLLNRSDPFARLPFDIERENLGWDYAPERLLVVGGYRLDGSRACIDRSDSRVLVFPRGARDPIAAFPDLSTWIAEEIDRYRTLYDEAGHLIARQEETGPPRRTN